MKNSERCFKDYLNGKISRRNFIRNMLYLGMSMATITSMLASAPKAGAAVPKRGGRVLAALSMSGPHDTLDPTRTSYNTDFCRAFQIYNTLVKSTPTLTGVPELAESWEPKPGAKEWIFKIRKGVEFHNGQTLTAADAVYSLKRHMGKESKSPVKPLLAQIEEIKTLDKYTLYVKLNAPNADLPMVFSEHHMHIIPDGFTDFQHAVGTGPFKVKVWKPGIRSIMERNANYWREGLPYLDEVETFAINEPTARIQAVLSGDIQLCSGLEPKNIPVIEKAPNAKILRAKGGRLTGYVMMCDRPPFNSLDLRLAMKYLMDRENFIKTIYRGYAEVSADQPICSIDPMYCETLKPRPYDPDKAKYHLKKAGMENFKTPLHVSNATGVWTIDGALLYQQYAAKGGVTIDVKREPTDGYFSNIWMKKKFCATSWNLRPIADLMLATGYTSDAKWNESFWKRPDFDKLLLESRGELDTAKRKEMYCTMLTMISDDAGIVLPGIPDTLDVASSKLEGITPSPSGNLGGWRFAETAWFNG